MIVMNGWSRGQRRIIVSRLHCCIEPDVVGDEMLRYT